MRISKAILLVVVCIAPSLARGGDENSRAELEALHARWFTAFDGGDGAAMDQMEMDKLVLVMRNGMIWMKPGPRAGKQKKRGEEISRSLSDVSVRRFGDTAILTGILTTKTKSESSRDATTVVFIQSSGKWKVASAQWSPVTPDK